MAVRQTCRQLKVENSAVHVLVGIWSPEARAADLKPRFRSPEPDEIVTTLTAAATHLENRATLQDRPTPADPGATTSASVPAGPRRASRERTPQEVYDQATRDLAQVFEIPGSLVKIIDADGAYWNSLPWFSAEGDIARDALSETWLANTTGAVPELVVAEDFRKDRRFAQNPILNDRGLRFYAGVPLRPASGRVVGFLCVIDTEERTVRARAMIPKPNLLTSQCR